MMFAPVSVRLRKIPNGTSGAGERSSTNTNARDQRRPRAPEAERLRRAPARVVGVDERVDEQRQAGGDRERARDVEAARRRVAALGAAAAARRTRRRAVTIGTLTNRTHSQPRPSVRTPPSSTPTAPPEPATAPQTPSALLRSAPSVKVVVRIASAAGREQRAAEALQRAGGDQLALGLPRSRRAATRARTGRGRRRTRGGGRAGRPCARRAAGSRRTRARRR